MTNRRNELGGSLGSRREELNALMAQCIAHMEAIQEELCLIKEDNKKNNRLISILIGASKRLEKQVDKDTTQLRCWRWKLHEYYGDAEASYEIELKRLKEKLAVKMARESDDVIKLMVAFLELTARSNIFNAEPDLEQVTERNKDNSEVLIFVDKYKQLKNQSERNLEEYNACVRRLGWYHERGASLGMRRSQLEKELKELMGSRDNLQALIEQVSILRGFAGGVYLKPVVVTRLR